MVLDEIGAGHGKVFESIKVEFNKARKNHVCGLLRPRRRQISGVFLFKSLGINMMPRTTMTIPPPTSGTALPNVLRR